MLGDPDAALPRAREAVEVFRELGDPRRLAWALQALAVATMKRGEPKAARALFEEAVEVVRRSSDTPHYFLNSLAVLEGIANNHQRALELHEKAIALAQAAGDLRAARSYQHNRACELRLLGQGG